MAVSSLLTQSEGKTLEFKRDLSSPKGIAKTIVAFANTAGGRIVIGVEDESRVPLMEEIGMRFRCTEFLSELHTIEEKLNGYIGEKKRSIRPGAQSGAQSRAQSIAILKAVADNPLSATKIADCIGLNSKSGSFKRTLRNLVDHKDLEYTIPEKPSSRLQKYRITKKGYKRVTH